MNHRTVQTLVVHRLDAAIRRAQDNHARTSHVASDERARPLQLGGAAHRQPHPREYSAGLGAEPCRIGVRSSIKSGVRPLLGCRAHFRIHDTAAVRRCRQARAPPRLR